jgi:predicted O-methyltransferase YrrM
MMIGKLRAPVRKWLGLDEFVHLRSALIELNDVKELLKVFGWKIEPVLDNPVIYKFDYVEDVNQRRIRDAECLGTVVCNVNPSVCLDIGTSTGHSAALMAVNAPKANVFTINIPPEQIRSGEGGVLTTVALEREQIGSYYRERKLGNIVQILENTARWEPNIGPIDVAWVDGCHDSEFVYQDTRKVLRQMKAGSFILWHDFNLELVDKYHWIHSVCRGVERLFADGVLNGRMFHVRDSWVGIFRVGRADGGTTD